MDVILFHFGNFAGWGLNKIKTKRNWDIHVQALTIHVFL